MGNEITAPITIVTQTITTPITIEEATVITAPLTTGGLPGANGLDGLTPSGTETINIGNFTPGYSLIKGMTFINQNASANWIFTLNSGTIDGEKRFIFIVDLNEAYNVYIYPSNLFGGSHIIFNQDFETGYFIWDNNNLIWYWVGGGTIQ